MARWLGTIGVGLVGLLSACSPNPAPAPTPPPMTATPAPAGPSAARMAALIATSVAATVAASTAPASPVPTAVPPTPAPPTGSPTETPTRVPVAVGLTEQGIVANLETSGLPISDVRVFTAETDPNKLLGRPGQYTMKVSWKDDRSTGESTIEVFPDEESMQRWATYVATVSQASPMLVQYIYVNPALRAVLRVSKELTLEQAQAYQQWLATLGRSD